jgi:protocatechuate 3,4-dioxygenase beta subunit
VPAFRDGGGPYYLPDQPFRENIAPESASGKKLVVTGKLYANGCEEIISDAVIDIWQASEEGEYENEYYRGQIVTDKNGEYKFETIVPLGYGEGTAYRPPHIHFKVRIDDKEVITSQMFFEDTRDKPGFDNAYIIDLTNENADALIGEYSIVLP